MTEAPEQRPQAGRPRWWVAGLSLCVLLAGGLLVWSQVREEPYVAPTATAPRPAVAPAEAAAALEHLEHALRTGDVEAARALAPADDTDAQRWLAGVVHNVTALRLSALSLRYVSDEGVPDDDGDWSAAVEVTWRYRGFDRAPAAAEVTVHFRDGDAGGDGGGDGDDTVGLTGAGGEDRVSPLWLQGELEVRRTADTLVLVDGTAAAADRYARLARSAIPVVRRVLPQWRSGLVVEVPASVDALERTLDAGDGTYDQIAAVTTSADDTTSATAPVHVFVNPDVLGDLKPTGAQVVISHEATHVAAGAWTSDLPLWLLEGFADYVALRDVDLPLTRSAAQILAEVRRDGAPRRLPTAADFGTRAEDLGATYESAWLAARLIARQAGEDALVAVYRAVDGGRPLGAALRENAGMSVAELTEAWRAELEGLDS